MQSTATNHPWAARGAAVLRIGLGWIFIWPFLDKTFGLGFATSPENAWIRGGSPTSGFLNFANPDGPFAGFFRALDTTFTEWLFMVGLLGIGLAFTLGMGVRIAAVSGSVMLFLMWLALLPLEHNPFLDEHLLYPAMMVFLVMLRAEDVWGLGRWWKQQPVVQNQRWLQ